MEMKSFNLDVDYSRNTKTLVVAELSSSGCKYEEITSKDQIKELVSEYIDDMLSEEDDE